MRTLENIQNKIISRSDLSEIVKFLDHKIRRLFFQMVVSIWYIEAM